MEISKALNKYPEIQGHSIRVFLFVFHALKQLPEDYLTKDQERNLLVAALFHDIGKSLWPSDWLTAPRKDIKESVWLAMQMHPVLGGEFLQQLGFEVEPVLKIIIQHHEKQDGNGYPNGDIPCREAVILSACDMFSAMTEDREYRKAIETELALKILEEEIDKVVFDAISKATKKGEC